MPTLRNTLMAAAGAAALGACNQAPEVLPCGVIDGDQDGSYELVEGMELSAECEAYRAELALDCDDSDPNVHPTVEIYENGELVETKIADEIYYNGAPERCEDRELSAQEQDLIDGDRDGDGQVADPKFNLSAVGIAPGTDCDDGDADVYSGARDTAADGYDQSCSEGDWQNGLLAGRGIDLSGQWDVVNDGQYSVLVATYAFNEFDGDNDLYISTDYSGFDWDTVAELAQDDDAVNTLLDTEDCHDGDARIYPGAPDTQDGVTEDCTQW